jgi:hypothetical protein
MASAILLADVGLGLDDQSSRPPPIHAPDEAHPEQAAGQLERGEGEPGATGSPIGSPIAVAGKMRTCLGAHSVTDCGHGMRTSTAFEGRRPVPAPASRRR